MLKKIAPAKHTMIFLLAIVTVIIGTRIITRVAARTASERAEPNRVKQNLRQMTPRTTVALQSGNNPRISLADGYEISSAYRGSEQIMKALENNEAEPLALAADDFDGDGVKDIVATYALNSGGILTLQRGNIDSLHPNLPAAKERKLKGEFTESPFLAESHTFELPLRPDFIGAGDFNADGRRDLVIASKNEKALYFLFGDGQGNFPSENRLDLPGFVTALQCGNVNRQDGSQGVVVGILEGVEARVLVFESLKGAVNAVPETFDLPARANDILIAELDGENPIDVAVAAGKELLIIAGQDRVSIGGEQTGERGAQVIRRTFQSNIRSLTFGHFNNGPGRELALLTDDGSIQIFSRIRGKGMKSRFSVRALESRQFQTASQLLSVRVSDEISNNLVLRDPAKHQLHIISSGVKTRSKGNKSALSFDAASVAELNLSEEPVAILPMRVNADPLSDLVILRHGQSGISVVPSAPTNTFMVTTTDDFGMGSLRQAIIDANASQGFDEIDFMIGSGQQTIQPCSQLPALQGIFINGTTQPGYTGMPLIAIDGSFSGGECGTINAGLELSSSSEIKGIAVQNFPSDGILIDFDAGESIVHNCFLGTDFSGTIAMPNFGGVTVDGTSAVQIGGPTSADRNLISGNTDGGIFIIDGASSVSVLNNYIGTDISGNSLLAVLALRTSVVFNSFDGITIIDSSDNFIGGAQPGEGNLISGNGANGVKLSGTEGSSDSNTIQGNFIGTNAAGTSSLGNNQNGVMVLSGTSNLIGGTGPGQSNIIAFNGAAGVNVITGTGNSILGNSIFSNTGLGINLSDDAVTPNDNCDADSGPNNLQNFPVISSAISSLSGTTIQGSLNSTASSTFRIEIFSNPTCDSSGNGEGQTFVGSASVTTDGACNSSFNVIIPNALQPGGVVTATATDSLGNTSEFSQCTVVGGEACVIACPSDITVNSTANQCGAIVNYPIPSAGPGCGTVVCKPSPGTFFNVGTTAVNCTLNGTEPCTFHITVKDQTRPQISCLQGITVPLPNGQTTAVVNFTNPVATDNCPGVHVSCSPASGTAFPAGTTTVNCTAADNSGNAANCSFTVNVVADTQPPVISCPANVTVQADTGQSSAVVTYPAPVATDNLPGVTVGCVPPSGSVFQLGTTTVNCTATDVAGNPASCSFTVTLQGGQPQGQVSIPGNKPNVEFPPTPAKRKPAKNAQCSNFSITNTGRTPLDLTFESIQRTGADVDNHHITDPNEGNIYELNRINSNGNEILIPLGGKVTIGVGETVTFCAKFIPILPRVQLEGTGLAAPFVLSDVITSRVTLRLSNGNVLTINLLANVAPDFTFINPNNPRKPPQITFEKQGDNYVLTYAIFDSNLDVKSSKAELLDSSGNVVATFDVDLQQPIKDRNLVRGQSFIIEQRFTGANANPQVTAVRLTVTDGTSSATITQGLSSSGTAIRTNGAVESVIALPSLKIKR